MNDEELQELKNTIHLQMIFIKLYFEHCDTHSQKNHAVALIRLFNEKLEQMMYGLRTCPDSNDRKNDIPF